MKRVLFGIGTILALVLLPWTMPSVARADSGGDTASIAPIAAAPVPTGGSDYAVGGGDESFGGNSLHFAFSAHENSPNPPTGYVVLNNVAPPPQYTGGTDKLEGPVQCLAVAGNLANIVFVVKKTSNPADFQVGEQILWTVLDNGNPNNAVNPDRAGYAPSNPSATQGVCNDHIIAGPAGTVTQGNVVVQDPVTSLVPCPSMTDTTTYTIDTSCNLYTNTGTSTSPTWTLMQ